MIGLRIVLFLVATLVLWYLGNMTLKAVWEGFDLAAPSPTTQLLNLLLLPLSAIVAWAVLRRVPDERPSGPRSPEGRDDGPEEGTTSGDRDPSRR